MAKTEPIGWITVNGVHVPLYESGLKLGKSTLDRMPYGSKVIDGNKTVWTKKVNDEFGWKADNGDKATSYALANLKEYKGIYSYDKNRIEKEEKEKEKDIAKNTKEKNKLSGKPNGKIRERWNENGCTITHWWEDDDQSYPRYEIKYPDGSTVITDDYSEVSDLVNEREASAKSKNKKKLRS